MFDLERLQLFVFVLNIYMLLIYLTLNNVGRYVFADTSVCVDILGRVKEVESNKRCGFLKVVRSHRKAHWNS